MTAPRLLTIAVFAPLSAILLSSCTVDQEASSTTRSSGAARGETNSFSEQMKEAREKREKERALIAKRKAAELKKKEKAEALAEKKMAAAKAKELAEKKKMAAAKAKEKAAREAAVKAEREKAKAEREKLLAEKAKAREAKIAAREKAERERAAREVAASASSPVMEGRGLFSRSATVSAPKLHKTSRKAYVNRFALGALNPSNAKVEVDLSDQRARIYKTTGGMKQLVIETKVSTGKPGHTTPTGTYRISEKLEHKRSTIYGHWVSSSGSRVGGSDNSNHRPSGGSRFVGAEMPYWLRVNGGIGMHIGYVPDHPASHGCIRVPSDIQPLIFSKVGVGTSVTITL